MDPFLIDKDKMRETAFEKNDAQELFEIYLEKTSKKKRELYISDFLHGILNLGILREKGFRSVKSILFAKGNITAIRNIPEGLQTLHCNHNLVSEVKDLPYSLLDLQLSHNGLESLDLSKSMQLKKVNISYNHLETLNTLPDTLEEFYCNNNRLHHLDLKRTILLKILHCQDNNHLKLQNIPEGIIEFRAPSDFQHQGSNSKYRKTKYSSENYKEELNSYFKTKSDYENKLREIRKKKREDRILPKCIGCNKSVGMTFSNKNRKYQVRCAGNPPCEWNMVVERGNFVPKMEVIESYKNDVQDMKEKIIQQKMVTLYRHMEEEKSTKLFEDQITAYKSANDYLEEMLTNHTNMFDNQEVMAEIEEKQLKINLALQRVNQLFKENNIRDAVEIQYKEIQPLSQSIQRLQYEVMKMIIVVKGKEYVSSTLLQEQVHPEKIEMNLIE